VIGQHEPVGGILLALLQILVLKDQFPVADGYRRDAASEAARDVFHLFARRVALILQIEVDEKRFNSDGAVVSEHLLQQSILPPTAVMR